MVAAASECRFHTRSGLLTARRAAEGWIGVEFPRETVVAIEAPGDAERALVVGVDVAHRQLAVAGRRRQLAEIGELLDVEQLEQRVAQCLLAIRIAAEAGDQAMGGEDRQPRILERDEMHQHELVLAAAADLLRIDARRLVAVVAVGDQQLGWL